MAFGTLSVFDAMASQIQTVVQFGEDRAWDALQAAIDAHNRITLDLLGTLVAVTDDRLRRYGGIDNMAMQDADEYSTPDAQKVFTGATVGFPLRAYQIGLQWTRLAFMTLKVNQLAMQAQAALDADTTNLQTQIKRALFTPTNYTFTDRRVDYVQLPVKALINADGTQLPPDPFGNTFDGSTHTHYLADTTWNETLATNLVNTVMEHSNTGDLKLYINRAQETATRAFAGFTRYEDPRIITASTTTLARGTLDFTQVYNRAIGIFGAAEVWVKPWIPSGYELALRLGPGLQPLVMRRRSMDGGFGNLQLVAEAESFPLRAQYFEREFGMAVWNRINAAVSYSGGAAYVVPAGL
jgi:hypothetical protein